MAWSILKHPIFLFLLLFTCWSWSIWEKTPQRSWKEQNEFSNAYLEGDNGSLIGVVYRWCHRIFPVQATCRWAKDDIHDVVVSLVKEFLKGHKHTTDTPVKVISFYLDSLISYVVQCLWALNPIDAYPALGYHFWSLHEGTCHLKIHGYTVCCGSQQARIGGKREQGGWRDIWKDGMYSCCSRSCSECCRAHLGGLDQSWGDVLHNCSLKCGYWERWALTSRIIFLMEMKSTSS